MNNKILKIKRKSQTIFNFEDKNSREKMDIDPSQLQETTQRPYYETKI